MQDSLVHDLATAARFGGVDDGITRPAWSEPLFDVYRWLAGELGSLGLEAEVDPAGNLVGRWAVGTGAAVVVGSHLDTVPKGGRFDGALGVLSGLAAIRMLKAWGVEPRRPLWLVAFMDEEGARFGTSLFGSRAFVGDDLSDLAERRDDAGVSLRDAIAAGGLDPAAVASARRIEQVGSYLELHIEQGPVLERAGIDIGIVSSITGVLGMRARFSGEANHAGTTPMDARRDALAGAARATLDLRALALSQPDMTANVGVIAVAPGGANVIPGAATFTIDVRSPSEQRFAGLAEVVRDRLERIAAEEGLELDLEETFRLEPLPLDEGLIQVLERASDAEGASRMRLPSGAGHDAMVVGRHVPAGMLFVPSRAGISHSPAEHTSDRHCALGATVLARALRELLADPG